MCQICIYLRNGRQTQPSLSYTNTCDVLVRKLKVADSYWCYQTILTELSSPSLHLLATMDERSLCDQAFGLKCKRDAQSYLGLYSASFPDIVWDTEGDAVMRFSLHPASKLRFKDSRYPGIYSDTLDSFPVTMAILENKQNNYLFYMEQDRVMAMQLSNVMPSVADLLYVRGTKFVFTTGRLGSCRKLNRYYFSSFTFCLRELYRISVAFHLGENELFCDPTMVVNMVNEGESKFKRIYGTNYFLDGVMGQEDEFERVLKVLWDLLR